MKTKMMQMMGRKNPEMMEEMMQKIDGKKSRK